MARIHLLGQHGGVYVTESAFGATWRGICHGISIWGNMAGYMSRNLHLGQHGGDDGDGSPERAQQWSVGFYPTKTKSGMMAESHSHYIGLCPISPTILDAMIGKRPISHDVWVVMIGRSPIYC